MMKRINKIDLIDISENFSNENLSGKGEKRFETLELIEQGKNK